MSKISARNVYFRDCPKFGGFSLQLRLRVSNRTAHFLDLKSLEHDVFHTLIFCSLESLYSAVLFKPNAVNSGHNFFEYFFLL